MILLDADVLLIDLRYPNDARNSANRQFLDRIRADRIVTSITSQAILEVVGILSFNLSPPRLGQLPRQLLVQYGLSVLPDWEQKPDYAGCSVQELIAQMRQQMALGDAVQAVQIARYAPSADALVTWNASHFAAKLVIPVLTPQEWLSQRSAGP